MKIVTSREVNAGSAIVWEVFGERFEDVSDWAGSIVKSKLNGSLEQGVVRTCDIKAIGPIAAGQVTEQLTLFDRDNHALTYQVRSGIPKIMESIENAWTIEKLSDNKSRVVSAATFNLKWWARPIAWLIRIPMTKAVGEFVGELKFAVEKEAVESTVN